MTSIPEAHASAHIDCQTHPPVEILSLGQTVPDNRLYFSVSFRSIS
jgi:hypothetical protein